jgi:hypothetical protein
MSEEALRKALVRQWRVQGCDPIASAEKTVTQLCGKLQDRDSADQAVYRAFRSQGLSISEASNALRLATALRTVPCPDLLCRLQTEEGSVRPCKRTRGQLSEEKKRKKPKI